MCPRVVDHPQFFIGGSQVENVDRAKYLGVIIDMNLEEHISNVRTKVSRAIGFLKYSRKFLPQNILSKMYSGIVEPHFRFCCSVKGCFFFFLQRSTGQQLLLVHENRAASKHSSYKVAVGLRLCSLHPTNSSFQKS